MFNCTHTRRKNSIKLNLTKLTQNRLVDLYMFTHQICLSPLALYLALQPSTSERHPQPWVLFVLLESSVFFVPVFLVYSFCCDLENFVFSKRRLKTALRKYNRRKPGASIPLTRFHLPDLSSTHSWRDCILGCRKVRTVSTHPTKQTNKQNNFKNSTKTKTKTNSPAL